MKHCGIRLGFVLIAVLVSACSSDEPWHLRDVSGLMPDLEFRLTRAADGATVTEADYPDEVRVLYFGYTSCPDICPATLGKFGQAIGDLDPRVADDIRFLFVSVDPKRDTPDKLAAYARAFGGRFVGLTSDIPTLRDLTKRYRVTFGYGEPTDSGFYTVSHSSAAFIFDRDGELRLLARQSASIDAIEQDLRRLANE
ncbi:MAG TPA: SCO family protein [Gammaproteobacteria bacterium]|nr:SCO family protein [Gammaproteobacteria bacterium]